MKRTTLLLLASLMTQPAFAEFNQVDIQNAKAKAQAALDATLESGSNLIDLGSDLLQIAGEKLPSPTDMLKNIKDYIFSIEPRDYTEMATKGVFDFATGYVVGTITQLSTDGLVRLTTSGEGVMFLGEDSNIRTETVQVECPEIKPTKDQPNPPEADPNKVCTEQVTINPWKFSYNIEREKLNLRLNNAITHKVLVAYNQHLFQHNRIYKTPYMITGVMALDQTVNTGFNCTDSRFASKVLDGPDRGETKMFGIIVKLAYQGELVNTWEMMIQENKYGGDFHRVSIHDDDMVNCVFQAMASGRPVELIYEKLIWQPTFLGDTTKVVKSLVVQ